MANPVPNRANDPNRKPNISSNEIAEFYKVYNPSKVASAKIKAAWAKIVEANGGDETAAFHALERHHESLPRHQRNPLF